MGAAGFLGVGMDIDGDNVVEIGHGFSPGRFLGRALERASAE